MTADLVAFLRARLDEDAARATAATPGPWTWTPEEEVWNQCGPTLVGDGDALVLEPWGHDAWGLSVSAADQEHIATWHPKRVLDEIDSKRRLIAECENAYNQDSRGMTAMADQVLASLALPFAHHPDYRTEWAPSDGLNT